MAEAVEAGAGLAWRLLATLEGGSLLVATSALLAYTARRRLLKQKRHRTVQSVFISNATTTLGQELKRKLEAHDCTVSTDANINDKVDSLVVIGAESKEGLDGITQLISQDVYENLNLLESLSHKVRRGGSIAWVCTGDVTGTYRQTTTAFDAVMKASLQHIARNSHCEAIWVDRSATTELAVERILAELLPSTPQSRGFSVRNAAHKVSVFLSRWLKMVN